MSTSTKTTTTTNDSPSVIEQIETHVDCEDLALRLGLERPGDRGRFRHPKSTARSPSIQCFAAADGRPSHWVDVAELDPLDSSVSLHGGPVELVLHARSMHRDHWGEAVAEIMALYGLLGDTEQAAEQQRPERWVAQRALDVAADGTRRLLLTAWLQTRGISDLVGLRAIEQGVIGLNDYTSPRIAAGQPRHGGDAFAAIARSAHDGEVLRVDLDYLQPELNGGIKTAFFGESRAAFWCLDWRRFRQAKRVILVAGALDALSVEMCLAPGTACVAVQGGLHGLHALDWRLFIGKQVVIAICPGKPQEMGPGKGYCPGLQMAWAAHEALVGLDVPALMLDQDEWIKDGGQGDKLDAVPLDSVNEALQLFGVDKLAGCLRRLEPWLIAGMPGDRKTTLGRSRIFLPAHDNEVYWRFRVRDDFTSYIAKWGKKKDDEGNETDEKGDFQLENVCGFRVAGISRVTIASPTSTMTGDQETSPTTIYALSVQVPRSGSRLLRRVVNDEQLHNTEIWKKLGPVFSAPGFSRLVNIMERAADIGARDAVNFVGLAWRNGQPVVNEGPDCYFSDPAQQCPYSNLVFPSGPRDTAKRVIAAYQATFRKNGVLQMLVWALGAHLKAFLGFWPHFVMQADKGTGKDTILKRLERSIGMTVFSRQSMQTEFRILTSVSYTSHPVGWGELSANKQDLINKAVANLQESYQYSHTRRGADLKDFLICAPVLLAGEDVPVKTLQGKIVRNQLDKSMRGSLMPEDLPAFPVRQWLEYLATIPKAQVQQLHQTCLQELTQSCAARGDDAGAERMLSNYGAVRAAWKLLCDFAGIDIATGGFMADLTAQMNGHIKDSEGERQPWVWIVDTLLSEISRGTFRYPFVFDETEDEEQMLCVRTSHVMDHIAREPSLREFWDALPVKSDRVFKRALSAANVVAAESLERTHAGKRVSHMVGLSLAALEQYGLYATRPADRHEPAQP